MFNVRPARILDGTQKKKSKKKKDNGIHKERKKKKQNKRDQTKKRINFVTVIETIGPRRDNYVKIQN